MPVNRWALLEEYFRWFQAGLIDDVAMLAETDVRGKENILKRKSVYSQLKSQVDQLESMLKDREGTIETLSRQVVQAGIREDINEAELEQRKQVQDTTAQQKLLRESMKLEANAARKDLSREVKSAINESRRGRQQKK